MPDWYEEGRKQKLQRRVNVHISATRKLFPLTPTPNCTRMERRVGRRKKRKGRRSIYEMTVRSREKGKNNLHQVEAGDIIYRQSVWIEKRQRAVFGAVGKIMY